MTINTGRASLGGSCRGRMLPALLIAAMAGCSGETVVSVPSEAKTPSVAEASAAKGKVAPRVPRGPGAANALRGAEKGN